MVGFASKHRTDLLLAALIVADVVLITLVFWQHRQSTVIPMAPANSPPVTSAASSQSPAPKHAGPSEGGSDLPVRSDPRAESDPPDETPAAPEGDGQRRILAANSDQIAWRATAVACGRRSQVEVTTDGGKSWEPSNSGLRSIVRLKSFGGESVFAVGADKDCNLTYAAISGPGGTWAEVPEAAGETWYRIPGDLGTVHAPGGDETTPCRNDRLVDLAGLGAYEAAVLCDDGRIRTKSEGRKWRTIEKETGAVALNADDRRFVAAMVRGDCDGLVTQTFGADADSLDPGAGECRKADASEPGQVAVSNQGDVTWLWAGDRVSTAE